MEAVFEQKKKTQVKPAPTSGLIQRSENSPTQGLPVFLQRAPASHPAAAGVETPLEEGLEDSEEPIQTKLIIGDAADPLETEAEAVGKGIDQRAGQPLVGISSLASSFQAVGSRVQRSSGAHPERRPSRLSRELEEGLARLAGGGQRLPESARVFFESVFQRDFGEVRVHTDDEASKLNTSVNAHAFTRGNQIYFAGGKYDPDTSAGRELLAHELTHVVQQGQAPPKNFGGLQTVSYAEACITESGSDSAVSAIPSPYAQSSFAVTHPSSRVESEAATIGQGLFANTSQAIGTARNVATDATQSIARQAESTTAQPPGRTTEDLVDDLAGRLQEDPTSRYVCETVNRLEKPVRIAVMDGLKDRLMWFQVEAFAQALSETPPPGWNFHRGTMDARLAAAQGVEQTKAKIESDKKEGFLPKIVEVPLPTEDQLGKETKSSRRGNKAPGKGAAQPKPGPPPPKETSGAAAPLVAPDTARPDVELLMPEPPASLSEKKQKALKHSGQRAGAAARAKTDLPTADDNVSSAKDAVQITKTETNAEAAAALVAGEVGKPEPSTKILELCDRIYMAILSKRPPNEDKLVEADDKKMAEAAGDMLREDVNKDVKGVDQSFNDLKTTPEGAEPGKPPGIDIPPQSVPTPKLGGSAGVPDPVPAESVSLDADAAGSQTRMDEAGMSTEPAKLVQDGPIAEAREAQGELQDVAKKDPAKVLAEQQAAIDAAGSDMAALEASALAALHDSRVSTITGVNDRQTGMVQTEQQLRDSLSKQAQGIFTAAQEKVNPLLSKLPNTAMEMWKAGVTKHSEEFKQHLAKVKARVDDRHSGASGFFVGLWDKVTGLPDWVKEEYDKAEETFGDGVCNLIVDISIEVNGVIALCEAIIAEAHTKLHKLLSENLPDSLKEWAAGQLTHFENQLEGLHDRVTKTRDDFETDLTQRAGEAVQDVREQIHELREAAKGLIGKIADMIAEFLDDPIRFIINGILKLVGISPTSFWSLVDRIAQVISDIADDPIGFAGNLLDAVGQGFGQFFDNIGDHLIHGLIDWLFAGLASVGVTVPTELSLKSVITFFLQLMGITWVKIRKLLVKHVGENNVALLEKAYEFIAMLVEKGPAGIFELIEDKLSPQAILDQVLETAKNFLLEALIKQVTARILLLFNPVGAILQALEAIYRVLKWIFHNAARLFTFIETIVNGLADIVAGNIGGMANKVESALAMLIAPVIDFLADYLGLGDLPQQIRETIERMQTWVEGILDSVIGWLVEKGRALLASLGLGKKEKPGAEQLGDIGETVSFSAKEGSHRLWVRESGAQPTVMVASDEETVSQKLARWKRDASKLGAKEGEARSLIAEAVSKLSTTEKEAYEAAVAKHEAEAAAKAASTEGGETKTVDSASKAKFVEEDQKTADKERDLSEVLRLLFDLFGEPGRNFDPIKKLAPMHSGSETIEIRAEGNKVMIFVAGKPGLNAISGLIFGPLGNASNKVGLGLAVDAGEEIDKLMPRLAEIKLLDNKIEESVYKELDAKASGVAARVSKIGTRMRISTLDRGTRAEAMPETITVTFFYESSRNKKYQGLFAEQLTTQLKAQESGLNSLSIDEWTVNVYKYSLDADTYLALDRSARQAVLEELQERAKQAALTATKKRSQYKKALKEIEATLAALPQDPQRSPKTKLVEIVTGRFGDEAEFRTTHEEGIKDLYARQKQNDARWKKISKTLSRFDVLHSPDQIAGGPGDIPEIPLPPSDADDAAWDAYVDLLESVMGASRVNKSIGASWKTRVKDVHGDLVSAGYKDQAGWPIWKLNLKLEAKEK